MSENIPAWVTELRKWESEDYDGIMGFPPAWVPQWHRNKFSHARLALFLLVSDRKVEYQEIKSRFDTVVAGKYSKIVLAIMKDHKHYDDHLYCLVDLYKAVLLDENEGLRFLADENAVSGLLSKRGHEKRDDYTDKVDFQKLARPVFEANHYNIAKTLRSSELSPYIRKYTGQNTLRDWLKEIRPEGKALRGRPKKR